MQVKELDAAPLIVVQLRDGFLELTELFFFFIHRNKMQIGVDFHNFTHIIMQFDMILSFPKLHQAMILRYRVKPRFEIGNFMRLQLRKQLFKNIYRSIPCILMMFQVFQANAKYKVCVALIQFPDDGLSSRFLIKRNQFSVRKIFNGMMVGQQVVVCNSTDRKITTCEQKNFFRHFFQLLNHRTYRGML